MSASISPLPVRVPRIGSCDESDESAAVFGSGVLSIVRLGLVLVLGQIIGSAVTSDSACFRRVGRDSPVVMECTCFVVGLTDLLSVSGVAS
jgi:hypothetical protein